MFINALSPLINSQSPSKNQYLIFNIYTRSDNSSFQSEKLTKTLSDSPIFINGKNLSID